MLKNYIVSAIRNLKKKPGFTIVNVLGLALGMATCLLISLYVMYDVAYDDFQDDNVYRIWLNRVYPEREVNFPVIPHSFGPQLVQDFPEVIAQGRCLMLFNPTAVEYGEDTFLEDQVVLADSTFLSVLTIPFKYGDPRTALNEVNSVVVSESIAGKLFGNEDPLGKTVQIFDESKRVTGVAFDYPNQSHFTFKYLIPMNQFEFFTQSNWVSFSAMTYLKLMEGNDPMELEAKFPAFVKQYASGPIQQRNGITYDEYIEAGNGYNYHLHHIKDIHLHANLENDIKRNGNIMYIYIFSAIAVFILVIACINFMNLSTARSTERGKEVGIRKVLGSTKKQLVGQFLSESIIISLLAALVAIGLTWLVLPQFNMLADRPLSLTQILAPGSVAIVSIVILIIGILAGLYPAFFISSFSLLSVFKGRLKTGKVGIGLRNGLVVMQFTISIALISATLIVFDQMNFMLTKPLGFNKENIIAIENIQAVNNVDEGLNLSRFESFKSEINSLPNIISSAYTSGLPGDFIADFVARVPGTDQKESIVMRQVIFSDDMPQTMKINLLEGRFFSDEFDDSLSMVLNRTGVIKLGLENPVGKKLLDIDANNDPIEYTIIGVIEDFHFQSLHVDLKPTAITSFEGPNQNIAKMVVRIDGENIKESLEQLELKWNAFVPAIPFRSYFLDSDMEQFYTSEKITGQIFAIFTFLAIVIACVGLLGLSAYVINQRVKEIGVRKVLGASVLQIIVLLSSDFIKLIGIAMVIAIPVAYYYLANWLDNFAYSTGINWIVFILAGMGALIIGVLTVCFQCIRAARVNPVQSLRDE